MAEFDQDAAPYGADLLVQAQAAVAEALAAGAQDASVGVHWGRSLEVSWRDRKLEKIQESVSKSLGVALYVDGRFSTHGTNDLDPGRLRDFLRDAVELTRVLEPDPFRRIPEPELYLGRAELELDLVDPTIRDLGRKERLAMCQTMEEHARGHEEVISATTGVSDGHGVSARATSNGFAGSSEGTRLWYGAECTLQEGEKRPEANWWVGGIHHEGLPDPGSVGAECLKRGLRRLGARKVSSRRTTMVVDREAAGSLIGRIFGALSAGSIQQKRSFLTGKIGERIASPVLTMRDEPLLVRGMGSRLWDGEGIAARPMVVLENGELRSYYVDTYYGRKLGWAPTTGGPSNVLFDTAPGDADALMRDVNDGLYVTSWLGGNANMTTGDFSFGLRGHLIEHGKATAPVSEMNVTGNYLDLLQKLVRLGDDPLPWSSFRAPSMVFRDVDFSGA